MQLARIADALEYMVEVVKEDNPIAAEEIRKRIKA
jgi:hypothetical protein